MVSKQLGFHGAAFQISHRQQNHMGNGTPVSPGCSQMANLLPEELEILSERRSKKFQKK